MPASPACFWSPPAARRQPPQRLAKASASSGLAKQNTTKSLSSRRTEYVSGVADRAAAALNVASLFLRPCTFSAGSVIPGAARGSPSPNLAPLSLPGDAGGMSDLDPDTAQAGLIGGVELALRRCPQRKPASVREDDRSILNDVFIEQDASLGIAQQPGCSCGRGIADCACPRRHRGSSGLRGTTPRMWQVVWPEHRLAVVKLLALICSAAAAIDRCHQGHCPIRTPRKFTATPLTFAYLPYAHVRLQVL
jgi:hypothetical protein